jgi:hypothetical protein
MMDLLVFLIAAIIVVTWDVGIPVVGELRVTRDGLLFRRKYPAGFRWRCQQEDIEDLASRLETSNKTDRRSGPSDT